MPRSVAPSRRGSPTRPPPIAWTRPFAPPSPWEARPTTNRAPERSLAGIAAASGRRPLAVAYDAMLEDDGRGLLYVPILNYSDGDLEPAREMLLHPRAAAGLGDGGAHCGVICDASQPTFMLTHWTRDRTRGERLPLEWIVKKQTHDTARLYGLGDRGTIEVGALADLNLIDYDKLQTGQPDGRRRPAGRRQPPAPGGHRLRRDHQVGGHHLRTTARTPAPGRDRLRGRGASLSSAPPDGPSEGTRRLDCGRASTTHSSCICRYTRCSTMKARKGTNPDRPPPVSGRAASGPAGPGRPPVNRYTR